ncbi:MAG TPA: hypothetical protein VME43_27460 [Bryobacteraceae bacterium]|nr:hypothetical protein [Bryobacteraceae bacterium]
MNDTELDQLLDLWQAPAPPPSLRRGLVDSFPAAPRRLFGVPVRWLAACAAAALCAAVCVAGADQLFGNPELSRFYASGGPGLYMRTIRLVSPPQAQIHWWWTGGRYSFGGTGTLHGSAGLQVRASRLSMFSPRTIYGYQYALEPAGGGQYRITFAPLIPDTLHGQGPYKFEDTFVAPHSLPTPQIVQMGQPVEVTLYQDASSRVYDRIVLQWGGFPEWPPKHAPGLPQGALRLVSPQLFIDGQAVHTAGGNTGSGPAVWLHLPGEGRYLIALEPQGNPRFVQAGQVNGSILEFQSEGRQFRIVCAESIATGAAQPVYVYHQQSFENVLDPAHPLAATPFFGNAGPASLHVE